MKICILGNGLSALVLARILAKKNIKVTIFCKKKKLQKKTPRTIGITNENVKFLSSKLEMGKTKGNPIKKIEIFKETDLKKEILSFKKENFDQFFIFEYYKIYNFFNKNINQIKNLKVINTEYIKISDTFLKSYDLVIDTELKNNFSKKYFFNKIEKKYMSKAYITVMKHEKTENNFAKQIFTKIGPLAYLPIDKERTSIVFSLSNKKNESYDKSEIKNLIKKYNTKYKILGFEKFESSNLKFSLLRKYFYKNVLAFGDKLHTIHPLAGQGFNMTLRDIKILVNLIDKYTLEGITTNSSILREFENTTKYKNIIFASSIDFVHSFFIFQSYLPDIFSTNLFKLINRTKIIPNYGLKIADKGL